MEGVVADLDERVPDAADDLSVDLVVDGRRHPPRRLLFDALPNQIAVVLHSARKKFDRLVEQLLMAVPFGDDGEDLPDERSHARLANAILDAAVDHRLHVFLT